MLGLQTELLQDPEVIHQHAAQELVVLRHFGDQHAAHPLLELPCRRHPHHLRLDQLGLPLGDQLVPDCFRSTFRQDQPRNEPARRSRLQVSEERGLRRARVSGILLLVPPDHVVGRPPVLQPHLDLLPVRELRQPVLPEPALVIRLRGLPDAPMTALLYPTPARVENPRTSRIWTPFTSPLRAGGSGGQLPSPASSSSAVRIMRAILRRSTAGESPALAGAYATVRDAPPASAFRIAPACRAPRAPSAASRTLRTGCSPTLAITDHCTRRTPSWERPRAGLRGRGLRRPRSRAAQDSSNSSSMRFSCPARSASSAARSGLSVFSRSRTSSTS